MSNTRESTFQNLHSQYHAMVLTLCRGFMKGDVDQAHDLVQDIFVNVWNALPEYRGEASYKTWIYRITVNTCLLQIRREKNRQRLPLEKVAHVVEADTTHHTNEHEKILYTAIGQLEEVDRLIIMMVLEEEEYEEIARIIGVTENNLRVKIHRIKVKLKTLIENERKRLG
jgi:RNA polymerase sigma-70 factor (ECF subfamily)